MRPRVLDWIVTIPFLISFGGILLLFDPLQRIARLFGQRPQEIVAGMMQIALVWAFRITGMRLDGRAEVEHPGGHDRPDQAPVGHAPAGEPPSAFGSPASAGSAAHRWPAGACARPHPKRRNRAP